MNRVLLTQTQCSTTTNHDMSDDERRERAGNAADVLMGLLDQLGFDDEGDDDCDSSDEE